MDRVQVRIEFRKAWWICPVCKQEDFTDLNVGTPSEYTHNCSKCGAWTNSFKECQGVLQYPYDTYSKGEVKQEDIDTSKQARIDAWVYGVKNPAPYIEPKPEEYDKMIADKQAEIQSLEAQKSDVIAKTQLIEEVG